jgi:hypothetical protein
MSFWRDRMFCRFVDRLLGSHLSDMAEAICISMGWTLRAVLESCAGKFKYLILLRK